MSSATNPIGPSKSTLNNYLIPSGEKEKTISAITDKIRYISSVYILPAVTCSRLTNWCIGNQTFQPYNTYLMTAAIGLECLARSVEYIYPQKFTGTQLVLHFPQSMLFCKQKLNDLNFYQSFCQVMNLKTTKDVAKFWLPIFAAGTCAGQTGALLKALNQDSSLSTIDLFNRIPTDDIYYLTIIDGIYRFTELLKQVDDEPSKKLTALDIQLQEQYLSGFNAIMRRFTKEETIQIVKKSTYESIFLAVMSEEKILNVPPKNISSAWLDAVVASFPDDASISMKAYFLNELNRYAPTFSSDEELLHIIEGLPSQANRADLDKAFKSCADQSLYEELWHEFVKIKRIENLFSAFDTYLRQAESIKIKPMKAIKYYTNPHPEIYVDLGIDSTKLQGEVEDYLHKSIGIKPSSKYEFDSFNNTDETVQNLCSQFLPQLGNSIKYDIVCTIKWFNLPGVTVKYGKGKALGCHINLVQASGKYIRTYDPGDKMREFKTAEEAFRSLINSCKMKFNINQPEVMCTVEAYLIPKKESATLSLSVNV